MLGRAIIALAAAAVAGLLLFKDTRDGPPKRAVAQLKPAVVTLDVPVDGTLYFAAARTQGGWAEESVFRLRTGDDRPVRLLGDHARAWHVSAWGDHAVVNTHGEGFMSPAAAVELATGRVIAEDAHLPVAGPRGRLAYIGYVAGRKVSAAFVRWGARGRFHRVLHSGITAMEFLPDGRLVVLERRDGRAWIVVIGRRGVEREFRTRGNPHHGVFVNSKGLIGYEGGTRRLRVYTSTGRLRANLDAADWIPAGTRGPHFLAVEREGERIAALSVDGEVELLGRHQPGYGISSLQWEPR